MKVSRPCSDFHRMTSERYESDTTIYCAICGGGICWPGEPVDFNEKGEICHPECLKTQWEMAAMQRNWSAPIRKATSRKGKAR